MKFTIREISHSSAQAVVHAYSAGDLVKIELYLPTKECADQPGDELYLHTAGQEQATADRIKELTDQLAKIQEAATLAGAGLEAGADPAA